MKPRPAPVPYRPAAPNSPIVFVHGNGDSGALWLTTLWRFESNGWPSDQLHACSLPYPLARDDDAVAQPGRSGTQEHMQSLACEVEQVLQRTGAAQAVLVANSRGGYATRNYVAQGAGATLVSHAILGGTPNHGVWARPDIRPGSEFNGCGPFLTALNHPGHGTTEVAPQVHWMTLRSDCNDKFAQAQGFWIGAPGLPTNVFPDGPALRGAKNLVLAGADHRETSFSMAAFAHTYRFITGHPPNRLSIVAEDRPLLNGIVWGLGVDQALGHEVNNLPLNGAMVTLYATDPDTGARLGPAVHQQQVDATGLWGPYRAGPHQCLEFVISAPGYATTHIYRSPFARSSKVVHLQADRPAPPENGACAIVTLTRPRGYFDLARDHIMLDGVCPPPDIPAGTAGVSVSHARISDLAQRTVVAEFNGERIAGLTWPLADGHRVLLEVHG